MLLLGSEIEVKGLTVFRDHISPRTFHYLPGAPRVVVGDSGKPGLQLLRYRGGREGGFLTLDVDLALEEAVLAAARDELRGRSGGEAELVPVLFHEGTVRLTALGVESTAGPDAGAPGRLVERVLGTAMPSLLGKARAIFSLELDREGASLVEAAIGTAGSPLAVVYDLAFMGLRPARGLRARVRYAMAYDYLRTRAAVNTLWFKADLDREAEALAREGHIEIEDVDYQGTDPEVLARRQEEVRTTLQELSASLFFRPATSPAALGSALASRQPAASQAWMAQGGAQAAFVLRALEQREEQELAYDLRETAAAAARVAPQGMLRLPDGADPAALVRDVTFEGSTVSEVQAFTVPDADWAGVEAIQVDVRTGAETRTLVLSATAPEGTAVLPAGPLEHRVHALLRDEPEALSNPDAEPPAADPAFHPLDTLHLALDPAALAHRRVVRVVLGAADPAVVRQVRGRLRAGDRSHEFLLDAAHPEHGVVVRGTGPLLLDAALITATGGEIELQQTVAPEQTVAVLNQPADRFQTVLVSLQDPLGRWDSAMVELERAEGEARRVLPLTAAEPAARWSAERPAGAPRTFRHHVRKVSRDGAITDEGWKEAAGSLLLVGDPDIEIGTVEVVPLGLDDTLGALVRLTSLAPPPEVEATVESLLEPGQPPLRVTLPFRRGAPHRYRVEGQVFLADGEQQIPARDETAEVLLLDLSPGLGVG